MIMAIQMNRRQKASLICILGLGIFATAAAVVKLYFITSYGKTGDWLWDSRDLTIWTVVECNVGIIAGNLPCLKPIFRTVLGSTYGRGSRKTSENYLSKPYGAGSKNRSIPKKYASLSSDKGAANGEFEGYGKTREAYMLTTIGAKRQSGGEGTRTSSSGRSSPLPGKESSESVARLNNAGAKGRGDITVTTKVDVSDYVDSRQFYGNGRTAKAMV